MTRTMQRIIARESGVSNAFLAPPLGSGVRHAATKAEVLKASLLQGVGS
jgi:hypothetical protein